MTGKVNVDDVFISTYYDSQTILAATKSMTMIRVCNHNIYGTFLGRLSEVGFTFSSFFLYCSFAF